MAAEDKSIVTASRQITEFARGLSLQQKLMLGGGALIVVATLLLLVKFAGKPEMKPLYSGMEPADAQALAAKLAAKKIVYEVSPDGGAVTVAADQLDEARLEVAADGAPHSGRMGFEIFDKPNWASSDFNEKVNYQRALEGELERTIQTLDGVASSRVHLALPAQTIFTERERQAKATVVLHLRRGSLSQETQTTITRLVAGAVDNLSPENVTVVDGATNRTISSGEVAIFGSMTNGQTADEILAARMVHTLEPVIGEGRVRASVRVEYDSSSSEENKETYDPNTAVALTMQKSDERNGGTLPGGVPGTASNVAGTGTTANQSTSDQSQSHSESGSYAVNRTQKRTVTPAGKVKRIAAALLVDDSVQVVEQNGKRQEKREKRSAEQMKQIESLASAAIGMDPARGDVISVQNISFQAAQAEEIVKPGIAQKVRIISNEWATVLRVAAMLGVFMLVYLLVLRPVKNQMVQAIRSPQSLKGAQRTDAKSQKVESAGPTIELQEATPELKKVGALSRQLNEKVKAEPAASSRLVQSWIRDGGGVD